MKSKRISRGGFTSLAIPAAMLLALGGCVGDEDETNTVDTTTEEVTITVNSAAAIAQESADDYDDNVNGLITGSTLKGWIDNWTANRPAGITGKLVILQVSNGETGYEIIKPNGSDVFTYVVPGSEWVETRSNGVVRTISMVLDGPNVDGLLQKYNIDPTADMIVCAQGTAGGSNAMVQGRCWYTLRYWGVEAAHLALLNGGNQWQADSGALAQAYFGTAASALPARGSFTVKDLPADNTILQATVEDMMAAARGEVAGAFIWDARSPDEYNGVARKTSGVTGKSCGDTDFDGVADSDYDGSGTIDANDRNCYTAFEGHPNGAVNLNYTELLNSTEGWRYRDKAELAALVSGINYTAGSTVYTYCRTTYRAMITGIASGVVLGYPTRFYDGAMVEWNQMSAAPNISGEENLPWNSPWRTDLATLSTIGSYNVQQVVEPLVVDDAYAESASLIITADKAYKATTESTDAPAADDDDGGVVLPSNPCGG